MAFKTGTAKIERTWVVLRITRLNRWWKGWDNSLREGIRGVDAQFG